MTPESALKLLGVHEGCTFDEVLRAKRASQRSHASDHERVTALETAYDVLLMQSLARRRAGKVVDSTVRFADVRHRRPSGVSAAPAWLTGALRRASLSLGSPSAADVAVQAALYGALMAWTFTGGPDPTASFGSDDAAMPSIQLAAGFGASVYHLRKQNVRLGKTISISTGGLVVGAVLGSLAEAWLHVELFPISGIDSPAIVITEFTLLSFCDKSPERLCSGREPRLRREHGNQGQRRRSTHAAAAAAGKGGRCSGGQLAGGQLWPPWGRRRGCGASTAMEGLVERWRALEAAEDAAEPEEHTRLKEQWFHEAFEFVQELPSGRHAWCQHQELMLPLLEPFYHYDSHATTAGRAGPESDLVLLWRRVKADLAACTRCIAAYHRGQAYYAQEFEEEVVAPLLDVLRRLDAERVSECCQSLLAKVVAKQYDPVQDGASNICLMFEVLIYPALLDDAEVFESFGPLLKYLVDTHDLKFEPRQSYPGVYWLLFHPDAGVRRAAHTLANGIGKFRNGDSLKPLEKLIQQCSHQLEFDLFGAETLHTVTDLKPGASLRKTREPPSKEVLWLGLQHLMALMEPAALEMGLVREHPALVSIVINHVSETTAVFWIALRCLRLLLEILGYKLWMHTTFSAGVVRNTMLSQCFHVTDERTHTALFDVFQPFLQSLEALQDQEYQSERRRVLYFLLQQVPASKNFRAMLTKKGRQIAFALVRQGYLLATPSPPVDCAHMWGPLLTTTLQDQSLYPALRKAASDLAVAILAADSAALLALSLPPSSSASSFNLDAAADDGLVRLCELSAGEATAWRVVPLLWTELLEDGKQLLLYPQEVVQQAFIAAGYILLASMALPRLTSPSGQSHGQSNGPLDGTTQLKAESSAKSWATAKGGNDGATSVNSVLASNHLTWLLDLILSRCLLPLLTGVKASRMYVAWTFDSRLGETIFLLLLQPDPAHRELGREMLKHFSKCEDSMYKGLCALYGTRPEAAALTAGLSKAVTMVLGQPLHLITQLAQNILFCAGTLLRDNEDLPAPLPDSKGPQEVVAPGGFLKDSKFHSDSHKVHPVMKEDKTKAVVSGCWRELQSSTSNLVWPLLVDVLQQGLADSENSTYDLMFGRVLEVLPLAWKHVNIEKVIGADWSWLESLLAWGLVASPSVRRRWPEAALPVLQDMKSRECTFSQQMGYVAQKLLAAGTSLSDSSRLALSALFPSAAPGNIGRGLLADLPARFIPPPEARRVSLGTEADGRESAQRELAVIDLTEKGDQGAKRGHRSSASRVLPEMELEDEQDDVERQQRFLGPLLGLAKQRSVGNDFWKVEGEMEREDRARMDAERAESHRTATTSGVTERARAPPPQFKRPEALNKALRQVPPSRPSPRDVNVAFKRPVVSGHGKLASLRAEHRAEAAVVRGAGPASHGIYLGALKPHVGVATEEPTRSADPQTERATYERGAATQSGQVKRQVIQLGVPGQDGAKPGLQGLRRNKAILRRPPPRLDDWYKRILVLDYFEVVGLSSHGGGEANQNHQMSRVPIIFQSIEHYVDVFRPLLLEELRAQLRRSHEELPALSQSGGADGAFCIRLMSLERVDDFQMGRFRADAGPADAAARQCSDSDLLLLSKLPVLAGGPPGPAGSTHLLALVDRKDSEGGHTRATILQLRLFLPSDSGRLTVVGRQMVNRSKWHAVRLISLTPQVREFQALAALHVLPLASLILGTPRGAGQERRPGSYGKRLEELPDGLRSRLQAEYNLSQLAAVEVAIAQAASLASSASCHQLMLVQGPPGTGKTKTIVGIVSSLLAVKSRICSRKNQSSSSSDMRGGPTAAALSPWQAAAMAKYLAEEDSRVGEMTHNGKGSHGRVLVCAQSNAAVDEIVARIAVRGLYDSNGEPFTPSLVRTGNSRTVHPDSMPFFIDRIVDERAGWGEGGARVDGRREGGGEATRDLRRELESTINDIQETEARISAQEDREQGAKVEMEKEEDVGAGHGCGELSKARLNLLYRKRRELSGQLASAEREERKAADEGKARRQAIRREVLRTAELVVTTLSGCGGDLSTACNDSATAIRAGKEVEGEALFDAVIIDEAAQALEPATLIPLQLLAARAQCIMVGDPKQLPATVLSQSASKLDYDRSMFERLQVGGHPVTLLSKQHDDPERAHCDEVVEDVILGMSVESFGMQAATRRAPFHATATFPPYAFFDIRDGAERKRSTSLCNDAEAKAALALFQALKSRYPQEITPGRFGIVTPYKQQLELLRSTFRQALGAAGAADLEMATVDGFQGREVDVLIFSTVRSTAAPGALIDDARSRGCLWDVTLPFSRFFGHASAQHAPRLSTSRTAVTTADQRRVARDGRQKRLEHASELSEETRAPQGIVTWEEHGQRREAHVDRIKRKSQAGAAQGPSPHGCLHPSMVPNDVARPLGVPRDELRGSSTGRTPGSVLNPRQGASENGRQVAGVVARGDRERHLPVPPHDKAAEVSQLRCDRGMDADARTRRADSCPESTGLDEQVLKRSTRRHCDETTNGVDAAQPSKSGRASRTPMDALAGARSSMGPSCLPRKFDNDAKGTIADVESRGKLGVAPAATLKAVQTRAGPTPEERAAAATRRRQREEAAAVMAGALLPSKRKAELGKRPDLAAKEDVGALDGLVVGILGRGPHDANSLSADLEGTILGLDEGHAAELRTRARHEARRQVAQLHLEAISYKRLLQQRRHAVIWHIDQHNVLLHRQAQFTSAILIRQPRNLIQAANGDIETDITEAGLLLQVLGCRTWELAAGHALGHLLAEALHALPRRPKKRQGQEVGGRERGREVGEAHQLVNEPHHARACALPAEAKVAVRLEHRLAERHDVVGWHPGRLSTTLLAEEAANEEIEAKDAVLLRRDVREVVDVWVLEQVVRANDTHVGDGKVALATGDDVVIKRIIERPRVHNLVQVHSSQRVAHTVADVVHAALDRCQAHLQVCGAASMSSNPNSEERVCSFNQARLTTREK
eukprot:SM000005S17264  [mRNA]  locus=s5:1111561:1129649:+ [translate_table: standard]